MTAVPIILFPDATDLAINWLRTQLTARGESVIVGTEIPKNTREKIRVFRTGGISTLFVVDAAQLTIETYAPTLERAADLAYLASAILHAMARTVQDGVAIYRVDPVSGLNELPDPITDLPRYSFSLLVGVRGATA